MSRHPRNLRGQGFQLWADSDRVGAPYMFGPHPLTITSELKLRPPLGVRPRRNVSSALGVADTRGFVYIVWRSAAGVQGLFRLLEYGFDCGSGLTVDLAHTRFFLTTHTHTHTQ